MRRFVFGILGLLGIALAAAPASAVNVPGCGEFLIFAKDDIIFENGLTLLTGNIFVQNPTTGRVKVGSQNIIHGTISAHRIFVGTNAVVDNCVADIIEGPGTCTTSTIGFTPVVACTASFPPPPLAPVNVPVCVTTAAAVLVPAGASQSLVPGCYGALRLNSGSTLTLTPGGIYNFKEVRQIAGSTLQTSAGAPASVNVKGEYITEGGVTLQNLLINVQSNFTVHIGLGALVQDVVFNVPNGNIHPHTGAQLRGNTELVARLFHDIQPITNEPPPPPGDICECKPGFHFQDTSLPVDKPERVCIPD
jgi:hypothetical protein